MANSFWQWFTDPTLQSMVVSPLIGAVLGLVLTAAFAPTIGAAPAGGIQQTVIQQTVLIQQRTTVTHNHRADSENSGLLALVVAVLLAIGLYARYSHRILQWTIGAIVCALIFVLAVGLVLARRNYPVDSWWSKQVAAPWFALCVDLRLARLAQQGIDLATEEKASRLGAIPFSLSLNNAQQNWILLQAIGTLLVVVSTLISLVATINFVSMLRIVGHGRPVGLWVTLYRLTWFASHWRGVVVVVFFNVLSYLALTGVLYSWLG